MPTTMRDWGYYFGYPKCCVEVFLNPYVVWRDRAPIVVYVVSKDLGAKGFIPCPVCAEEIKNNQFPIDVLDHYRKPKEI